MPVFHSAWTEATAHRKLLNCLGAGPIHCFKETAVDQLKCLNKYADEVLEYWVLECENISLDGWRI